MDAPTNATTPTIPVTFWFQGDLQAKNCSDLTVGVVDVKLADNESLAISAHLPNNNLRVSEAKQIEFSLRQKGKTTWNGKVTEISLPQKPQNTLDLKVDQLRSMTLIGGFFEPGRRFGPVTLYPDGTRHQQQSVIRTDHRINLSLPETFENGAPYRLIVTSDDLNLSAKLVREGVSESSLAESAKAAAPSQALTPEIKRQDLKTVESLMLKTIAPLILSQSSVFHMHVSLAGLGMSAFKPSIDIQALGINAMNEVLATLPPEQIHTTATSLRKIENEWESAGAMRRSQLDKAGFQTLTSLVSQDHVAEIMRLYLSRMFINDTVPPLAKSAFDQRIERAKELVAKYS